MYIRVKFTLIGKCFGYLRSLVIKLVTLLMCLTEFNLPSLIYILPECLKPYAG